MLEDTLARAAIALVVDEDPVAAQEALAGLSSEERAADWPRWLWIASLLMAERVPEALSLVGNPPDGQWDTCVRWSSSVNDAWSRMGTGSITNAGASARFVDLGGEGVRLVASVPETNQRGCLVEFVARRGSGIEGDCRLELCDGAARESVSIDPGFVRLLNAGGSLPLNTNRPHHFALWLHGQRSRLFVDGQPALEARGLQADHRRQVTFGIFSFGSSADAESHWWGVRALAPARDATDLALVPRVWPQSVWEQLVHAARDKARPSDALSLAIRARLAHPQDPRTERLLLDRFQEVAQADELGPIFHRAVNQLALSDRALVVSRSLVAREQLVTAENIGISFERTVRATSVRALVRRLVSTEHEVSADRFWAVRSVSFELRAGEMLAIIGRNGAGKSTLLRLIAGLLRPQEGQLTVAGKRILLSLGGSFLPDLTGRDNLRLAGLYLGMTRREIDAQFDEIVEFAELWDAIDRPLRTYSTGMMGRLQFALATTVSPEVLMLDELLGAGDASFVEKAQARMNRLLRRAKAVVVVTHNLEFVEHSCSQAILLERGEVLFQGSPEKAAGLYRDLLQRRPKRAEREA